MSLSDRQIERYSRQIIVPGFGGRGQERILASRLRLAGTADDVAVVAPYLIGAGFGAISIGAAGGADAELENLAALNADCTVTLETRDATASLALLLIGDADALEFARSENSRAPGRPVVVARLDRPARLVSTPAPPPCPRCLHVLEAPFSIRAEAAITVAMAAATETIKLAAGSVSAAESALIIFDGYDSRCVVSGALDDSCPCRRGAGR